MEQYISFETAKLASEKGFNEAVSHSYDVKQMSYPYKEKVLWGHNAVMGINIKDLYRKMNERSENLCAAPSQSVLQKWLRENYNLDIFLRKSSNNYYFTIEYNKGFIKTSDSSYGKYEDALENALLESLNLI